MRASSASSGWRSWGGIVMASSSTPIAAGDSKGSRNKRVRLHYSKKRIQIMESDPFISFGVGLILGAGLVEGGQLQAGGVDGADARVGVHRHFEAMGVGDLRHEAGIGDRR